MLHAVRLAFGNEYGIAIIDIVQKTCLLSMGTPDLYGMSLNYILFTYVSYILPRNAHANHIRRAVYAVARYLSVCDKYRNGWRLVFLELPSYCRHETFSVMIQIKLSVY